MEQLESLSPAERNRLVANVLAVAVPLMVNVPATVNVLPEPTFMPTEVPVPSDLNKASKSSKFSLSLVPQESAEAPGSGFVSDRFVVSESAMISL
jgi:hypothetical protein